MNYLKTTILLSFLTVLLLLFGLALGGRSGMIIALVFAAIMNFSAYWFSDKVILKMYNAQLVNPSDNSELYNIVSNLATYAQIPMPKVYIIKDDSPNAFATGRNPSHAAVAATTGILKLLNKKELRGVMAHELSHVIHRDTLISSLAATIGGAIAMLANIAQYSVLFGHRDNNNHSGSTSGSILMIIIGPIAASLIQFAISRSREFAADAGAAKLTQDPNSLASALEKIESYYKSSTFNNAEVHPATAHMFIINPLRGEKLKHLFSTHPPTKMRVERLRQMNSL